MMQFNQPYCNYLFQQNSDFNHPWQHRNGQSDYCRNIFNFEIEIEIETEHEITIQTMSLFMAD